MAAWLARRDINNNKMSKYLRKFGRYNLERAVPDHRVPYDFNHPMNGMISVEKLKVRMRQLRDTGTCSSRTL